jgi:C4-dicarboxylate-specific signal transduction histidine kinase
MITSPARHKGLLVRLLVPLAFLSLACLVLTLGSTLHIFQQTFTPINNSNLQLSADILAVQVGDFMDEIRNEIGTAAKQYESVQALISKDPKNFAWYADALNSEKKTYALVAAVRMDGSIAATNAHTGNHQYLGTSLIGHAIELPASGAPQKHRSFLGLIRPKHLQPWSERSQELLVFELPIYEPLLGERLGSLVFYVALQKVSLVLQANRQMIKGRVDYTAFVMSKAEPKIILQSMKSSGQDTTKLVSYLEEQSPPPKHQVQKSKVQSNWPSLRWEIIVAVPNHLWQQPLGNLNLRIVVTFICSGILALMVSILVTRRLLRPLHKVTTAVTEATTASEYQKVAVQNHDEIGVLTQILNNTFEKLSSYETGMERLVYERTETLATRTLETEQALKALERAQEELIQTRKHAAMAPMVNGMAHEINTPLGVGLTSMSRIQELHEDLTRRVQDQSMTRSYMSQHLGKIRSLSDLILDSLSRAICLVNDFKQLSIRPSVRSQKECFKLRDVIELITLNIESLALGLEQDLTINIMCDDTIHVVGSSNMLTEVLQQLGQNSLLHAAPHTTVLEIAIKVSHWLGAVTVEFSDNGPGFPNDGLATVLDPFVTTLRGDGCVGLGLTIAYNTVTLNLGGKMWVSNRQGLWGSGAVCTMVIRGDRKSQLSPEHSEITHEHVEAEANLPAIN